MRGALALAAACALSCSGGDKPGSASASARPAASTSTAAPAPILPSGPRPLKACDLPGEGEHVCYELFDEELANEEKRACAPTVDGRCPAKDRSGACRLPDGSVRYGYPPKTPQQIEKQCKESLGKYSPTGEPPPGDEPVLVSCVGKQGGACEEEQAFVEARAKHVESECAMYGGTFKRGEPCPREGVLSTCDLPGKRTVVFLPAPQGTERDEFGEDQRLCESRRGRFVQSGAAASASASAAPAADPTADRPPQNTARPIE
jgi:hypothetical protein